MKMIHQEAGQPPLPVVSGVECAADQHVIAADAPIDSPQRSCLVVAQSAQVIKAAMQVDADLEMVLGWFENDFIDELGGTAMHLVIQGRQAQLMAFLDRVACDMVMDAVKARRKSVLVPRGHIPGKRYAIHLNSNQRNGVFPSRQTAAFE